MPGKLGTQIGMIREGTILRYNGDGTVRVALNEGQLSGPQNVFNTTVPSAWSGPNGEFMGGGPVEGSAVNVRQGHGGQWYIVGYGTSNDVFDLGFITADVTQMSALVPGRALIQVKDEIRIFVDPKIGIQAGDDVSFLHANPKRDLYSRNFNEEFSFTGSGFELKQVIKRDLVENSNRNILGSTLDSQNYENSLFRVGIDPTLKVTNKTQGDNVRNPALMENRELITEFDINFNFRTDREESAAYVNADALENDPPVDKRKMRSDLLSLSLEHPNHLIETVKGTVVDSSGNILDINRVAIPIGRSDGLSLIKNPNKSEAFDKIRTSLRKSVAYHFEINTRKGGSSITPPQNPPNVVDNSDYARDRSKFSVDIDKEGQFKINVPSSSEVGNIPLLTRYENYSNILADEDNTVDPNAFVRNEEKKDIFLEDFSGTANITLTPGGEIAEYGQAVDRFSNEPIKLGTSFHDITKTVSEFQTSAGWVEVDQLLVPFWEGHPLNTTNIQLDQIVSEEIIVSGPDANGGGRSGAITLDGFISLNVGANTIDRQSMWFDYAGSVIGRYGRDKQGISYAASMDGDVLVQIGGPGIGNSFDSRFEDENDANRNGKLDIRVLQGANRLILRMDETGIHIISPGRITMTSQQDMIFKSNGSMKFEAENIVMFSETSKRIINRFPETSI